MGITDELKTLQNVLLQNPKQRGGLGEYYQKRAAKCAGAGHVPDAVQFKDGEIVDAVVKSWTRAACCP